MGYIFYIHILYIHIFYPLQNNGDLCDVTSIIMASIVCLSPNVAEHVFVTPYGSKNDFPYLYLSERSKYGKYLRSVLAIWMVNRILTFNVLSQHPGNNHWLKDKYRLTPTMTLIFREWSIRFSMTHITIRRMQKFLQKPRG